MDGELNHTSSVFQSLKQWRTWIALAVFDLRAQYRRTSLGMYWIVVATLFFALVVGSLWTALFDRPAGEVIPWLSVGGATWWLILGVITGGATSLTSRSALIKTLDLPLPGYVIWLLARLLITFLIAIVTASTISWILIGQVPQTTVLVVPGMLLLSAILLFLAMLLSLIGARYRSLVEVLRVVTLPLFLLTPVIWQPSQLGASTRERLVELNPIGHWIALIRDPILGSAPAPETWVVAICSIALLALPSLAVLRHKRSEVVYWTM